jgi:glycogen debranching enzyme
MQELHEHQLAWWITAVKKLHFKGFINLFRRDLHYVPGEERLDTIDALAFYSTQRRLRRKNYDIDRILRHSLFAIEDVNFNAILIRANTHLQTIAKTIHAELPETLQDSMAKATIAFEGLWDPYSNNYYSREFVTHRLLKNPTIGTLLPLYGGSISKERAALLVKKLEDEKQFGLAYPAPSVPANSDWFNPIGYWQGPTWVNTNWLIINGLEQYGYKDHAAALREATLELVSKSGFSEYFNPLNGTPAGVANFSWTAALTIDLLSK